MMFMEPVCFEDVCTVPLPVCVLEFSLHSCSQVFTRMQPSEKSRMHTSKALAVICDYGMVVRRPPWFGWGSLVQCNLLLIYFFVGTCSLNKVCLFVFV